jgi:glyoxylate reductase
MDLFATKLKFKDIGSMKVLITRVIPGAGMKLLEEQGFECTQWKEKRNLTQEELISLCLRHDALLSAGSNRLDAHFFNECHHLQAISLLSAGYDNVDMAAANRWKKPIGHTPGVLSNATADVALLLMLAVSRNAFYHHRRISRGEWGFFEPTSNLGFDLAGKTLGIYGLGRIGLVLARKCTAAFGMEVIYHNRNRNYIAEAEVGATYVSFDELLSRSDVLSVHANLSPATLGLFNLDTFRKMKTSSIFINTARGSIHNEEDLTTALKRGLIRGAGLDVTDPEPMSPSNELLEMPHVCILPHIGSATQETRNAMSVIAARNIIAALQGEPMPHAINPEVYQLS